MQYDWEKVCIDRLEEISLLVYNLSTNAKGALYRYDLIKCNIDEYIANCMQVGDKGGDKGGEESNKLSNKLSKVSKPMLAYNIYLAAKMLNGPFRCGGIMIVISLREYLPEEFWESELSIINNNTYRWMSPALKIEKNPKSVIVERIANINNSKFV